MEEAILSVNKSAAIQFTTLAQQVDDSLIQERLFAASYLPTRRALRTDPMVALRYE